MRVNATKCKQMQKAGSGAVSKQMSDKLQFVAQSEKLKHVGHQTVPLREGLIFLWKTFVVSDDLTLVVLQVLYAD